MTENEIKIGLLADGKLTLQMPVEDEGAVVAVMTPVEAIDLLIGFLDGLKVSFQIAKLPGGVAISEEGNA